MQEHNEDINDNNNDDLKKITEGMNPKEFVRSIMGKTVECTVVADDSTDGIDDSSDDRNKNSASPPLPRISGTKDNPIIVTGDFICMDRLKNIILSNVTEKRYDESNRIYKRHLSQAMIPGKYLVKIQLYTHV